MTKKKGKGAASPGADQSATPSNTPAGLSASPSEKEKVGAGKKAALSKVGGKRAAPPASSPAPLIICRNKHWRYIACFHGPWLHMQLETLDAMCNINFDSPRPYPVDPAVFFDIVKIRKLIEEATDLAVRAASDGTPVGQLPGGPSTKLSPERKFRIYRQACQKLAQAYRLDEIACSVATMQGASTLDGIAEKVLQRDGADKDALYVHFFHQKIPSRQLADHTSLAALDAMVARNPTEAEILRTRGVVKMLVENLDGAARDFGEALNVHRMHGVKHRKNLDGPGNYSDNETLKPSSLEPQLLFFRANVFIHLAIEGLHASFSRDIHDHATPGGENTAKMEGESYECAACKAKVAEMHKKGKTYAKRALKDVLAFLALFEYTQHLPVQASRYFNQRVSHAASGSRNPRLGPNVKIKPEKVYKTSDLFMAKPPADLPPFPIQDMGAPGRLPGEVPTHEAQTYHPLLMEALYVLLLSHVVLQTSRTELLRHAYNVARLARILDAYPVFQASRSICRSHWVGLLDAWRGQGGGGGGGGSSGSGNVKDDADSSASSCTLVGAELGEAAAASTAAAPADAPLEFEGGLSWEQICAPAPLPRDAGTELQEGADPGVCNDHYGMDRSIVPNQVQDNIGYAGGGGGKSISGRNGGGGGGSSSSSSQQANVARWSVVDDGKEHPYTTDWAGVLARWISEVGFVSMGPPKKKKKRKKPTAGSGGGTADPPMSGAGGDGGPGAAGVEDELENMDLGD